MSAVEVRSPGQSSGFSRERLRVLLLAVIVIAGVGLYLAFGRDTNAGDAARMLPYQVLVRTLPESEQQIYGALRKGLRDLEAERAQGKRWMDPPLAATRGIPPYSDASGAIEWRQFQQGATVNYFGVPKDPAAPAWILTIQEPEPNQPPDPAPLDDEHHRLPDGTTLHIYIWMHKYGGQVPVRFVPQPQTEGWSELFATPPNPVLPVAPVRK